MADFQREYSRVPLFGVGAIIVQDMNVALVRRANDPSKGKWSIPGGLLNLGESLLDAVIREAFEETRLTVRPLFLVELLDRIFCDESGVVRFHYILADYWCEVGEGDIQAGSDASDALWAPFEDLTKFDLADITLQVIQKGFDLKRGHSMFKHPIGAK